MLTRWFGTSQKNSEILLSTRVISIWWKKAFRYVTEMPLSHISCEKAAYVLTMFWHKPLTYFRHGLKKFIKFLKFILISWTLIIAGVLIFVGYWSISNDSQFRGCSFSIWYLLFRNPQWHTGWNSLQPGMGKPFK